MALLVARPGQAEIRGASVAVNGMACPFCAFGVEKRLKKVQGVERVVVSTKDGIATLTAKAQQSIDVEQIPRAVRSAGFTPGPIMVEAVGRVETDGRDRVVLRLRGTDQAFLLAGTGVRADARLRSLTETGALVVIRGAFHLRQESLPAISPEVVEEIPD